MERRNTQAGSRSAGYARYHGTHRARRRRRNRFPIRLVLFSALVICALAAVIFAVNSLGRVELHENLTVEIGSTLPDAVDFLVENDGETEISYAARPVLSGIGSYDVTLLCDGKERKARITVEDTVCPTGETQPITAYPNAMPKPEDFIVSTQDATEVSVSYAAEPDKTCAGEQKVTLLLKDAGGNETRLAAVLTLIIDNDAPVIEGVGNKIVYIGDTVAYRAGVTVTDDTDEAPRLTIDSGAVDLTTPGVYDVVYTAQDKAGNAISQTITVTVLEKREEYVDLETIYAAVDKKIAQLVNDGMDTRTQVETIYNWARTTLSYADGSAKDDWVQGAYIMLTRHSGDCFNYYAVTKLMFERLGIPNIDVHKIKSYEGDSSHYWSLVSVDGGATYYHFDATPRKGPGDDFCLVTDAFLDAYSDTHNNSHNRDKTLYPATPEV